MDCQLHSAAVTRQLQERGEFGLGLELEQQFRVSHCVESRIHRHPPCPMRCRYLCRQQ